jgi:Fur family peroxide stress response transcriptional regulator
VKGLDKIRYTLKHHGLKATPQRIAIYQAMMEMHTHPTSEEIIASIKQNFPSISSGTVYKTLDTFVQTKLIKRVKTDHDIMRYDPILKPHHHLYCIESERIEDFFDDRLNRILEDYFKKHRIPNFKVDSIKLQITGKFSDQKDNISK